jgi:hypothetical protein
MLDDEKNFWPFTHWRPGRHEDMTPDLCLKMSVVHTGLGGIVAIAIMLFESRDAQMRFVKLMPAFFLVSFGLTYVLVRFVFARAWNRRARALRGE